MRTNIMDNFNVDVTACERESLVAAVGLALNGHPVTHWSVTDGEFVVYWSEPKGVDDAFPFPTPQTVDGLVPMLLGWLADEAPRESEPNLDGSTAPAWRVHRPNSGGWSYEQFRVRFVWALIGK